MPSRVCGQAACVDPESFVKGGPTQIRQRFVLLDEGERIQINNTNKRGPSLVVAQHLMLAW